MYENVDIELYFDNYFNYNGFLRIYILTFWGVVAFWVSVQNTEKISANTSACHNHSKSICKEKN